jgi:hypothetical protein
MKRNTHAFPMLGIITLIFSLVAGCASTSQKVDKPLEAKVDEKKEIVEGVPGGVATRTSKIEAKVTDIDYQKRSVTLTDAEGNSRTMTLGPEVRQFDALSKGDDVSIEYIEEQVVYLSDEDKYVEDRAALTGGVSPDASSPGSASVEVIELVATVTAVDLENHSATLVFSNGKTFEQEVRPDVELLESYVGRQVVIRHTTAIAIAVEKM